LRVFILFVFPLLISNCEKAEVKNIDNIRTISSQIESNQSQPISMTNEIPSLIIDDTRDEIKIPENLLAYIKRDLPDCKIPDTSEFINSWQEYIDKEQSPFYISSDFNGDGLNDYAITLLTSSNEYCVFVFNSSLNGFSTHKLRCFKLMDYGIDVVIKKENKGVYDGIEGSVTMENDFIDIVMIESSLTVSYYWQKDHYQVYLWD
jgi:hypothetical protein